MTARQLLALPGVVDLAGGHGQAPACSCLAAGHGQVLLGVGLP